MEEFLNAVFRSENLLLRCLFNEDSVVFTGNDNQEIRYDTCFQAEDAIEVFNKKTKKWGFKPNPYHDKNKYDYFIKKN